MISRSEFRFNNVHIRLLQVHSFLGVELGDSEKLSETCEIVIKRLQRGSIRAVSPDYAILPASPLPNNTARSDFLGFQFWFDRNSIRFAICRLILYYTSHDSRSVITIINIILYAYVEGKVFYALHILLIYYIAYRFLADDFYLLN